MPGPGLLLILFYTTKVWCELRPPNAKLHYILWDITFFYIIAFVFSMTIIPSLWFLYILFLRMSGKASLVTLIPASWLNPIK